MNKNHAANAGWGYDDDDDIPYLYYRVEVPKLLYGWIYLQGEECACVRVLFRYISLFPTLPPEIGCSSPSEVVSR